MNKRNIYATILIITLIITVIIGSFQLLIFNKSFYYSEYEKYGIYDKLGSNGKLYANNITNNVFDFFNSKSELKYFGQSEQSHMQDVKHVILYSKIIYYICSSVFIGLIIFLIVKYKKDQEFIMEVLSKTTFYSGIILISSIILFLLMVVFYFDTFFILFHSMLFPQGNYLFDPSSLLLTIFPKGFFIDAGIRITIYALFESIFILLMGIYLRKHVNLVFNKK